MSDFLKLILSLSLSGTILILLLFVLRPIYGKYLSKQWQYYIWLIVIARLLLPLTPEVSLTGNFLHRTEQIDLSGITTDLMKDKHFLNNTIREEFSDANQNALSDAASTNLGPPAIESAKESEAEDYLNLEGSELGNHSKVGITGHTARIILTVWLIIALFLFMRKITIYQSFVKYVKAGSRPIEDIALLEHFGQIKDQLRVRRTIDLCTNSLVSSPLLIGFLHPRIILPNVDLSETEFYYTILHELIHEKRQDMFYKWLVQITICLHWFNPVIYRMSREIDRLCELSCDERVIAPLSANERKAYGDTLLNAVSSGGSYGNTLASVTLNESKELLKGRLTAIMKYRNIPKSLRAAAIFFTGILVGAATVLGAYAAPAGKSPSDVEGLADTAGLADTDSHDDQMQDYIIQCENGTYYVLTDGASEADKPISGVTNGYHHLVYVKKDGYSSFGSWNDHEMQSLVRHLSPQFRTLLENDRITQKDVDIITAAAAEIQEEYLSASNASLSSSDSTDGSSSAADILDLKRITKQDLPDTVQTTLDSCDSGKWFVIDTAEYQYIYYNGLSHNYAYSYEPQITGSEAGDPIHVAVFDIETHTPLLRDKESVSDYVLLAFSHSPGIPDADYDLMITYNKEPMTYEFIMIGQTE